MMLADRLGRLVLVLAFLCALAAPRGAGAQEGAGAVEGTVTTEEGAPLAFALVRLLPAEGRAVTGDVITDARGGFRLLGVPAGEYRLQVEQIGYARMVSPVVRVRAGETARQDVVGRPAPIRLEGVTATAGRCLTVDQLGDDPELATLWNEARKGVETRRALEMRYRFNRTLVQDIVTHWRGRGRGSTGTHTEHTLVSHPDSVAPRDARRRALFLEHGYSDGNTLSVPEDKELLEDAFLRDHCLVAAFEERADAYVIRFRAVRPPPAGADIRGTIRLDARGYLIQSLEFEYLAHGRPFARTLVRYEDVPVGGARLRLPTGGEASIRFTGSDADVATAAESTFSYLYVFVIPRTERADSTTRGTR
ncbi:carboxypeptidase-like regulatory domain-containing protein [Longimicrobium sp.]|uniref:carboxypeptidase-like regulatory domain-containing protein n=1 Tax=Longimicrobium sp. TaxID=2029185 RepID=UPI002E2F8B2E|nr:carboxypeptidase-like regulatory domain-containing protein [Longimicrobium sp.]HEX6041742.1 carboxypeptidase-like regulatory domain-containing protein [Longimicrobium sp.]